MSRSSASLAIRAEMLEAQGWSRLPMGQALKATAGAGGAQVWIKDAALQHTDVLRMPE